MKTTDNGAFSGFVLTLLTARWPQNKLKITYLNTTMEIYVIYDPVCREIKGEK
jgi:hypothetical protein